MPDPKNPQSLNRYAYTLNNPLRYRDPAGHNWEDVVYNLHEFTGGFLAEWAYINTAQMAQSLAVQQNESVAATAGRTAADIFGIYQGVEFMAGGVGLMGAGVTACATGVLCPAGAAALAGGGVLAADGAVVTGFAAVNGGKNLSNLYLMSKKGEQQRGEPNPNQFGARGPKGSKSEVWTREGVGRIDVENWNPGYGDASLHFQSGNGKWKYNPTLRTFERYKAGPEPPRWLLDMLNSDMDFQAGINKALKYLGEAAQW